MRKLFPIAAFSFLLLSCSSSGTIKDIEWMLGDWAGTDVNTLVFHEHWEHGTGNALLGYGATLKPEGDTLFHETLKIDLVEGVPYYYATLPKSKEPVLFKMIQGDAKNAIFENKDHDFPKRISYILETNNTMKVKLEGIENGVPKIETLEFERNKTGFIVTPDSLIKTDTAPAPINIQIK